MDGMLTPKPTPKPTLDEVWDTCAAPADAVVETPMDELTDVLGVALESDALMRLVDATIELDESGSLVRLKYGDVKVIGASLVDRER